MNDTTRILLTAIGITIVVLLMAWGALEWDRRNHDTPTPTPTAAPPPGPTATPRPVHPVKEITLTIEPGLTLDDTVFRPVGAVQLCNLNFMRGDGPNLCEEQPARDISQALKTYLKDPHSELSLTQPDLWVGVSGSHSVTHVHLSPEALAHKVWDNLDTATPTEYEAELSDTISISSEWGWEVSHTTEHTYSVNAEVGFGDEKAGTGDAYTVSTTRGESGSHSRTLDVGTSDTVKQEVPPHTARLAILLLQRGTLIAELTLTPDYFGTRVAHCVVLSEADNCDYDNGPIVTLKQLRPLLHSPGAPDLLQFTTKFAADSLIKIVDIPSTDPDTIKNTLTQVTCEFAIPKQECGIRDKSNDVTIYIP